MSVPAKSNLDLVNDCDRSGNPYLHLTNSELTGETGSLITRMTLRDIPTFFLRCTNSTMMEMRVVLLQDTY